MVITYHRCKDLLHLWSHRIMGPMQQDVAEPGRDWIQFVASGSRDPSCVRSARGWPSSCPAGSSGRSPEVDPDQELLLV